jgi:hypothetical protein
MHGAHVGWRGWALVGHGAACGRARRAHTALCLLSPHHPQPAQAYQYTSVTSVTLLDCFTVPAVMALSVAFLRARFALGAPSGLSSPRGATPTWPG